MSKPQNIPYGYCQCGCGQKTRIAPKTDAKKGWTKGEPLFFIYPHRYSRPLEERLWDGVEKGGSDDCWVWTGTRMVGGYGRLVHKGSYISTHRLSYEMEYGPIPDGYFVCHRCDNPPCVNPRHLFLGTPAENSRDMRLKKRSLRGVKHRDAKLTEKEVREIRALPDSAITRRIAEQYGVHEATIASVRRGQTWKHVTP